MFNYKKQLILKEIASFFIIVMGSYLFNQIQFHLSISIFIVFVLWEFAILMLSNNGISGRVLLRYSFYYFFILIVSKYLKFFYEYEINQLMLNTLFVVSNIILFYTIKRLFIFFTNINHQKIVYKGSIYIAPLKVKVQVEIIKAHLLILRILRNLNRCLSYLKSLGIVAILWVIFLIIMAYIDITNDGFYMQFIIEIRDNISSIFTSLILVAFTTVYKENVNYKKVLENQFDINCRFNYISDSLINKVCHTDYYGYIFDDFKKKEDYLKYLDNSLEREFQLNEYNFDELVDILKTIKRLIEKNEIIYWKENYGIMLWWIDNINHFLKKDVIEMEEMRRLIDDIYQLIEYTRKPWRRDYTENQKIFYIVNKYECKYKYEAVG